MRRAQRFTNFFLAALVAMPCGGAMLAAQDPTPPAAPERRVRVVRGDSTFVKVMINGDEVSRMISELMASKALEQAIAQSMREAASGAGDTKKMRELADQLGRIAQKNSQLLTTIEMRCSGDHHQQGYIGVQFDLLQTASGDDVPAAGQLHDYPKVDMVYQDSPASKAGIRRGDVVLSLGGQDTRRVVVLDKILKPGTKLPVRIQRDGVAKDVVVTIEKKPSDYNTDCANVDSVIGPEFDAPVIFMQGPRRGVMAATPRSAPMAPSSPDAPATGTAPTASMTPMPPMPPMPAMAGGFGFAFSNGSAGYAGAMFQALDDDWRATLGVDNGVLVFRVAPGSPAKEAGLRNGDVIVSADGETVSSVRALQRILGNSESKSVRLGIIRAAKPQTVVLRWK